MKEKARKFSERLEELREVITKYETQKLKTHRSEEDKVKYMDVAMVGVKQAQNALSHGYKNIPSWNFKQLYTALDAWLQHEKRNEKSLHRYEVQRNTQNILGTL